MSGQDLLQISKVLEDCLSKVKILKSLNVRSQRYEETAKLRDIEKQLKSISEQLGPEKYTIPQKGLTPKGKLFYTEIFQYCKGKAWKDIPENFQRFLNERKSQLNKQIAFDDENCSFLLNLSQLLKDQEDPLIDFHNFIQHVLFDKDLKSPLENLETAKLSLKCFTQSNYYDFNSVTIDKKSPFYEIEFSLIDLISSLPLYYDESFQHTEIFDDLPQKLRDEGLCLLFAGLAKDGILSWSDFLNISQIKIDLNIKYQFTRLNITIDKPNNKA